MTVRGEPRNADLHTRGDPCGRIANGIARSLILCTVVRVRSGDLKFRCDTIRGSHFHTAALDAADVVPNAHDVREVVNAGCEVRVNADNAVVEVDVVKRD